eukprot:jgi/Botrbrau1/16773/Bobra.150_2s0008.1
MLLASVSAMFRSLHPLRTLHPGVLSSLASYTGQLRWIAEAAHLSDDESISNFASTVGSKPFLPESRRTGVIGVKVGMTQDWDQFGVRMPLTVIWIDECEVVQVKAKDKEGYDALVLGCGAKREKQLHSRQVGQFRAAGVPLKRKLAEFKITGDAVLPVGTPISAMHFTPGQYVDVQGITIGKGFQGVMKRWGFRGQPASHGNSLAHRAPGSIGACQDPGKVWKGKKMAGRMGADTRTVVNAWLYKVDPVKNLLYVKGQIPGHRGNFVKVRDAVLKRSSGVQPDRPFPTFIGEAPEEPLTAPFPGKDPFDYQE